MYPLCYVSLKVVLELKFHCPFRQIFFLLFDSLWGEKKREKVERGEVRRGEARRGEARRGEERREDEIRLDRQQIQTLFLQKRAMVRLITPLSCRYRE